MGMDRARRWNRRLRLSPCHQYTTVLLPLMTGNLQHEQPTPLSLVRGHLVSCGCSCSGLNSCLHAAPGGPSASCGCSCSGLNSCLHAAPGGPSASCGCSCSGLNSCLHAAPGGPSASCGCSCSGLNSCLHAAPGGSSRLRSFPGSGAEAISPHWFSSPMTMPRRWGSSSVPNSLRRVRRRTWFLHMIFFELLGE